MSSSLLRAGFAGSAATGRALSQYVPLDFSALTGSGSPKSRPAAAAAPIGLSKMSSDSVSVPTSVSASRGGKSRFLRSARSSNSPYVDADVCAGAGGGASVSLGAGVEIGTGAGAGGAGGGATATGAAGAGAFAVFLRISSHRSLGLAPASAVSVPSMPGSAKSNWTSPVS